MTGPQADAASANVFTPGDRATLAASLAVVVVVLFLFLVWPGRYVYHDWQGSVVRIHNVSGAVDYLGDDGWHRLSD